MAIQLQKPDYIIIYVSNMQRSLIFYRDVLGLPLKFTSPGWTEFDTGETKIALHMAAGNASTEQAGRPSAGIGQLGFIVDNLQTRYEELKTQDVHFSLPPQQQPSGLTLAVLHDPDGFGITLQQRA